MNYSLAQFVDEFANLDFDGDGSVSISEMINFELKRLCKKEILFVGIVWIGHCINPILDRNKNIIHRKFTRSASWVEGSDFYPWFELNHLGQSICLNEYATQIASGKHTHIIHLDDKNPENDDVLEYHVDDDDVQEIMLEDRTVGRM